jgi:hypothetical protein
MGESRSRAREDERARRQIELANRFVADEQEAQWNSALQAVGPENA